jgi:hypothetical protein
MPAIRDYTVNYNTSTSAQGFTQAAPTSVSGDLLLAMISADTGTQVYGAGDPISYCYGATAAPVYTDYTTAANNDTANDVNVLSSTPALNAALYCGHARRFRSVAFLLGTAANGTFTVTWEYWNGSAWTTLPSVTDGTTGYTAAAGVHRLVYWSYAPGDWATTSVNGTTAYWVRGRISAFTSVTTAPLATRVWIGEWQQLFATVNTSSHGVVYKQAASEPAEYLLAYTVAETTNGLILSIRNYDTKAPFSTTNDGSYAESNADTYQALDNTTTGIAQSFASTSGQLASASFYLKKNGTPTGNAVAKLYAHSGSLGTTSVPTGVALQVSEPFDVSTLTTTATLITFGFTFQYPLANATNYCIALEYTSGTSSNYIQVGYDASSPGHAGNKSTFASAAWSAQSGHDTCFYVTKFAYTTGTHSAAKSNMPTMTTSRNKTMLLYMATNSGVAVPSIIEGSATLIAGKDGTAHSDACSWSFQNIAGTTASNVGLSNMTAAAGTTSVIGVQPPESGTVVVPGYCAVDDSVYVSPFTGAAFNSDAVPVNTITTQLAGANAVINGTTLTNAVNTYTLADYGINTYHAMAKLTGVATNNTWAGWSASVVARTTLAGKNILFHISPQTPISIQTTDSVATANACGIAIGLGTSANNFKFWHVHGAGTAFGAASYVPVVVNTNNTTGLIQTTGTLNVNSIERIAVATSAKVVAATWLFGSIWALDKTVIAGGDSTEPVSIPGIVSAASSGHERYSCVIQGAGQMLALQPLQFGDGGVNNIYLDLNSTAIEFPTLYNKTAKKVNYCSVENFSGLTYFAGNTDTIKHRNSVVSSESKYHWRFATASVSSNTATFPSATYDFDGLSVIGAGNVWLNANVDLTGVTFNACDKITAVNNVMTRCVITKSAALSGNAAVYITGASQSALQTSLDKFVTCSFTFNTTPTAALELNYTGAAANITLNMTGYTFSNNTKDIYWTAPSNSALTINNLSGTNANTYSATNSNTVTFLNAKTFIISNIIDGSEIRILKQSDSSELAGAENVGASPSGLNNVTVDADPDNAGRYRATYSYNYISDIPVYVVAHHLNYQWLRSTATLKSTNGTLQIAQITDRQYANPA